jgi:hypothetical protein
MTENVFPHEFTVQKTGWTMKEDVKSSAPKGIRGKALWFHL